MFEKKILGLVGAVGGTNLLVTILAAAITTAGIAGPAGPAGSTGESGLPGPAGSTGEAGSDGVDGQTPYIGENGNWFIGTSDTGISAGGNAPATESDYIVSEYDLLTNSLQVGALEPLTMETEWDNRLQTNFTPISTQAELEAIVDGGAYILTQDITITSPLTPIGYNVGAISIQLDGNSKTIYDLTVVGDSNSSSPVGLFSYLTNSVVFNLTISGADVTLPNHVSQAGVLVGQVENSWIKNVTVTDSQVNGIRNFGVLAGSISASEVKDVTLTDNTLTAISYAGGLAMNVYTTLIENVLVSDLTFEPDFIAAKAENINDFQGDVGGLIGFASQGVQLDTVTVQSLDLDLINGQYVDGYQYGVSNVGGIIGRANGNSAYEEDFFRFHNVSVLYSSILAGYAVGGFVGRFENGSSVIDESVVFDTDVYVGSLADGNDTLDLLNLNAVNFSFLDSKAGGFIGSAHSSGLLFTDTYVTANIIAYSDAGGYVGYTTGDDYDYEFVYVKNAISNSDVFVKSSNGGGFGGYWDSVNYVVIENSANLSDVNGYYEGSTASSLGGFVGEFYEIYTFVLVSNSYNAGNVIGGTNIGAIAGYNEVEGLDNEGIANGGLLIYNFYNSGNLYGSDYVGGFVGEQYNQDNILEIYNSFNAGHLYNTDGTEPDLNANYYGGFVAYNESSTSPIRVYNSFYLEQINESGDALPVFGYDNSNSLSSTGSGLPITGFITLYLSGSQGSTGYTVANLDVFTDAANFYFDGIWNFEEAWTFDTTNNGLPTLVNSYSLPA